jgi:hypothetical protein
MEKFRISIDSKHTVWYRTHVEVEAESFEEAKKEAIKIFDEETEWDLEDTFGDTMLDTMEPMTIEDNGGACTRELYVEGDYVKDNITE